MTLYDPQAGERCSICGHLLAMHVGDDKPVPCYAAVDRHVIDRKDGRAVEWKYDYCKCQHLMNGDGHGLDRDRRQ